MKALSALVVAVVALWSTVATAVEAVEIPHGEGSLKAVLFRPQGPGPFPAIVALHDCSGVYTPAGEVRSNYRDWGERLTGLGFAVLFPDSFGSRNLGPQCSVRDRPVRPARERLADAIAARHWLQQHDWVKLDRVTLLGWSNGATSALYTVRPRYRPRDANPDFRAAVVFYPACRQLGERAWNTRVPTLVLIGAADDWASAPACAQMIEGARGRSALAAITIYPNAYHFFDYPDLPVGIMSGLAFTANGSGRAHVGTNPEAREDALKRVPEWLSR